MFDADKWNEIFISISKHKLRTALTALGVFWGIFMLVLLLGAGKGLQNGVEHQFKRNALNAMWLYGGWTTKSYKGFGENRNISFSNEDLDLLLELDGVEKVASRIFLSRSYPISSKGKNLTFNARGVHENMQYIENLEIREGRYISAQDNAQQRKVVVIGTKVKQEVFGNEEAIGAELKVGSGMYKVVGVFYDSENDNAVREMHLPVRLMQTLHRGDEKVDNINLLLTNLSEKDAKIIETKIRNLFGAKYNFDPTDKNAIDVDNSLEEYAQFQGLFRAIRGFLWFVGLGSILAGIIGVSNIMLIIVKDRTREIGIRKALGATPRSIVSMILSEAIFITSFAGYFGLAAGILVLFLASGIESDFFRNPEINLGVGLLAIFLLVVAGALAGLIPSMKAARINPVVAMKS